MNNLLIFLFVLAHLTLTYVNAKGHFIMSKSCNEKLMKMFQKLELHHIITIVLKYWRVIVWQKNKKLLKTLFITCLYI